MSHKSTGENKNKAGFFMSRRAARNRETANQPAIPVVESSAALIIGGVL